MQANDTAVLRDIVLIGGGHSHVGVLRMFGMKPWPGVRLTVICTDVDTPYSGMLPGYIAGHYSFDEVHIDLQRLCAFAGARFYKDEVTGIDRAQRKVICRNRPAVSYDALSINIGSTPAVRLQDELDSASSSVTANVNGELKQTTAAVSDIVPVKPIARFNQRWLNLLHKVQTQTHAMNIAVVGGGAGGVELLLSMQYRLRNELQNRGQNPDRLQFHLMTAGDCILPTHNPRVRSNFMKVLSERGVHLHLNTHITGRKGNLLIAQDGRRFEADEVMWVTQAAGAAWLQTTGLELDDNGFVCVGPTLQTTRDPLIFAAGDIASLTHQPLEKAGVFAVRMGKPLTTNLRRVLQGHELLEYRPQSTWLALISTGNRYAVASKGWIGFAGDWVWRWKDRIDREFMRKFTQLPAMGTDTAAKKDASTSSLKLSDEESLQAISALAMRCGGCGAKVGATVLSRALGALKPVERDDVLVGLHAPDDAAIVRVPPGKAMIHTVDFFRAFVDDPYTFGRIAANHALGDIFAMGGEAQTATAVVTVPPGLESKTEDTLYQMMSGAVDVLNDAGCALVGGHTGEGKELALGFAINGLINEDLQGAMIKGGLRPGDALVLTKPFGTGTLFAALPQGKARGRWIQNALHHMQISNRKGAAILAQHGAKACTDLTGFGLLGHLVEMTKPSGVDVQLNLTAIPLLDGAEDCVRAGVFSSLQPANVRLRRAIRNPQAFVDDATLSARYALLFDPQTAGGLLASVPGDSAQRCIEALRAAGYREASIIGTVMAAGDALEPVVLNA